MQPSRLRLYYPLIAAVIALAPALVALAWPRETSRIAMERLVELQGPIISFSQKDRQITVRIARYDADGSSALRQGKLIVRAADGSDAEAISVKTNSGQTYLSASLSDDLASAKALSVSFAYATDTP